MPRYTSHSLWMFHTILEDGCPLTPEQICDRLNNGPANFGKRGNIARNASLSAAERSSIARHAALVRWGKV